MVALFVEKPPPASGSAALPAAERPPLARTFWQRRVRDPIVVQLTQGITPEKIALTLAVGSACALFPLFGTTSLLCFLVALALRLNQPIIQALNQVLLPVHIGTFIFLLWLGEVIFRVPVADRIELNPLKIHEQYFTDFWGHPVRSLGTYLSDNGDSVFYAVVAWAICVPPYVALVYFGTRPIMRSIGKVKAEVAVKRAAAAPPPDHPVP